MTGNTVLAYFIGKLIILLSIKCGTGCNDIQAVLPPKNRQEYGSCWKSETNAGISIVGPVKVAQPIGMRDYVP